MKMNYSAARGFTLIELMIVVVIVGILAAIGLPAYQDHTRKARRSEAMQLMVQMQNRLEQYILDARTYTKKPTDINVSADGFTCDATDCRNNHYIIDINTLNGPPPGYQIRARINPGDGSLYMNDLDLNSDGSKTGDGW